MTNFAEYASKSLAPAGPRLGSLNAPPNLPVASARVFAPQVTDSKRKQCKVSADNEQ